MKLRLVRNHDAFSIITETAADYKIKILDLRLVARKIKPSQDVLNHHQRLWKSQNAVFQFHQVKVIKSKPYYLYFHTLEKKKTIIIEQHI